MQRMLLTAILAAPLIGSDSRTIEGHAYPVSASTAAGMLSLVGVGDADWGWFDVHTSALYLPAGADRAAPLGGGPVRLILRYQRDFTAADFVKATTSTFSPGLTPEQRAAFAPRLARWNALFTPRAAGQEWRLTWLPGVGLELADETGPRGLVEGDDFARAMLAIWLGDPPVDAGLRRALTGR
ncbi:MAG: hypothetical protein RLZZ127_267 [Planctomycetota bacterium]|jgi:hypothetical protein